MNSHIFIGHKDDDTSITFRNTGQGVECWDAYLAKWVFCWSLLETGILQIPLNVVSYTNTWCEPRQDYPTIKD